jgi:hypothetical protein
MEPVLKHQAGRGMVWVNSDSTGYICEYSSAQRNTQLIDAGTAIGQYLGQYVKDTKTVKLEIHKMILAAPWNPDLGPR